MMAFCFWVSSVEGFFFFLETGVLSPKTERLRDEEENRENKCEMK